MSRAVELVSRSTLVMAILIAVSSTACFAEPIECQRSAGRCVDGVSDGEDTDSSPSDAEDLPFPDLTVTGLSATSDRVDEVLLTWSNVEGASTYHVYRDGVRLTEGNGVPGTTFEDRSVEGPAEAWQAPGGLTATFDDLDSVRLEWGAPARPLGPEARYQVRASGPDGAQGLLSEVALGRRAAPTIVRYEIEVTAADALPAWVLTSGIATWWTHETPPRARLETGMIVASQGAHRASVRLQAEGVVLHEPGLVSYRVRGVLADASVTPLSELTQGGLAPPMLEVTWERSKDGPDGTFEVLADASLSSHDVTAPKDGSPQWYRVRLSVHGVTPFTSEAVAGWRLAFESVSVGGSHACALDTDRRAWCWGNNSSGELGRGFESATAELPAPADLLPPSQRIVSGSGRTCFVDLQGELGCVGGDPLGVSFPSTSVEPVSTMLSSVTSVGLGDTISCATDDASSTWCWGSGYLGNGADLSNSQVPVRVKTNAGNLFAANKVAHAVEHGCALVFQGVRCWGANQQGQLGVPNIEVSLDATPAVQGLNAISLAVGDNRTCAVTTAGHATCWGATFGGSSPRQVEGVDGAIDVAAGSRAFCARLVTGGLRCWGTNDFGELGQGSVGGASSASVVVAGLDSVTDIAAGGSTFCAVSNGDVLCWGLNTNGALGDGSSSLRALPAAIVLP